MLLGRGSLRPKGEKIRKKERMEKGTVTLYKFCTLVVKMFIDDLGGEL